MWLHSIRCTKKLPAEVFPRSMSIPEHPRASTGGLWVTPSAHTRHPRGHCGNNRDGAVPQVLNIIRPVKLLYTVMYNIIWGFFLLVSRRAQCLLSVYFLHNVSNFRLFIFFLPPNSSSHDTIWCLKDTGWHLVTPTQSSCNSVSSAEFRTTRHPLLYFWLHTLFCFLPAKLKEAPLKLSLLWDNMVARFALFQSQSSVKDSFLKSQKKISYGTSESVLNISTTKITGGKCSSLNTCHALHQ